MAGECELGNENTTTDEPLHVWVWACVLSLKADFGSNETNANKQVRKPQVSTVSSLMTLGSSKAGLTSMASLLLLPVKSDGAPARSTREGDEEDEDEDAEEEGGGRAKLRPSSRSSSSSTAKMSGS